MKRVLIADEQEIIRTELRSILTERCCPWSVVGEAENGVDAISLAVDLKPDVAIIDHRLPTVDGIAVTRAIGVRAPSTQVIFVTSHHSELTADEALRAGARAYLLKSDTAQYLIAAIRAIERGSLYFSSQFCNSLLQSILSTRSPASSASRWTKCVDKY